MLIMGMSHSAAGADGTPSAPALLVRFQAGVPEAEVAAVLARHGAVEAGRIAVGRGSGPAYRWWRAQLRADAEPGPAAAALRAEPSVELVEIEQTYELQPPHPR
jgi:hypothetical protein